MDCRALLTVDSLLLETRKIRRVYRYNNGHLRSESIEDRASGAVWSRPVDGNSSIDKGTHDLDADLVLPGEHPALEQGVFNTTEVAATQYASEHLLVRVGFTRGNIQVLREFRLFPDSPAISCTFYLRGETQEEWLKDEAASDGCLEGIASPERGNVLAPVFEIVTYPERHLCCKCVQFFDVTDVNNTLIKAHRFLPYTGDSIHSGNLLMGWDIGNGDGFFMLKEAPCSDIQLASPGFDFLVNNNRAELLGLGIQSVDLKQDEWTRAYGFVTGLACGGEEGLTNALRAHKECARTFDHHRDSMIMLNTWGDRSEDTVLTEQFCRNELEKGAQLGITHFLLDAGWQKESFEVILTGKDKRTHLWDPAESWRVNRKRFPDGLGPVVAKAKGLGIEVGLWYSPCPGYDYQNWEKDADVLIDYYQKFTIRLFKIDGIMIFSRAGEVNLRRFLDKVRTGTDDKAVFNLDATAGRRLGYNYFYEYGNYFIENRYTDWGNYYPHWTLRNLWMLSEYIPPQFMQFEFLNNTRNPQMYGKNDSLAPQQLSFEYCFAITMAAQPLAWFEASGLPPEAFSISSVIHAYREHQDAFHRGRVLPIGDEPLGNSWTGFQSIAEQKGYFLVFRENNEKKTQALRVRALSGKTVTCSPVCGSGTGFTAQVSREGTLSFELPERFSYAFFEYEIQTKLIGTGDRDKARSMNDVT
ncbi:MAG: alpha-galactosidase [Kiritimatiellae bacterium]|nr:alpha-galactosidase [Kiritimatiellia bacterium]